MVRGKLDFRKEDLVPGAIYGMFFQKKITKIIKDYSTSVVVELKDFTSNTITYGLFIEINKWFELKFSADTVEELLEKGKQIA